jgi:negative regulator of genetic competence, sporulation and motility
MVGSLLQPSWVYGKTSFQCSNHCWGTFLFAKHLGFRDIKSTLYSFNEKKKISAQIIARVGFLFAKHLGFRDIKSTLYSFNEKKISAQIIARVGFLFAKHLGFRDIKSTLYSFNKKNWMFVFAR